MEVLSTLPYVGIAALALLLVVFEGNYKSEGSSLTGSGYTYYTPDRSIVRIRHIFGSCYKIYVNDPCPVPVKQDRFGDYFTIHARSASEAELQIDELYRA